MTCALCWTHTISVMNLRPHRLFFTDIVFFSSYARGRYVLNGRTMWLRLAYSYVSFSISCVTGSCTCMFPFPVSRVFLCYCSRLTTHPCLLVCLMLTLFGLLTCLPTRYSWTLTRTMTRLLFTAVCTCILQSDIYTIGDGDSSLIFNLLCNHPKVVTCEIPRNLQVLSSSLAKATASRFLGVHLLCLLAYR